MKKLVTILFVLALLVVLPLNAFAATGINANEQTVLDKLSTSEIIGESGWHFSIPQEYINSAKNYFAGDCDMTEAERDAILSYISSGMSIVKKEADSQDFKGTEYHLSKMSASARDEVLALGKKACAEVELKLTYIPASNQVVITPMENNTPVFESAPVIKTTGQEFALNAGTIAAVIVTMMAIGTVAMFVVSKKNNLV